MAARKHRNLEIRAAYLHAATDGLGLNRKWMARLTPFLSKMIDEGEIVLRREGSSIRSSTTTAYTTPAGDARLASLRERYGASFGADRAIISRAEPSREPKFVKRKRLAEPTPRHVKTAERHARFHRGLTLAQAVRGTKENLLDVARAFRLPLPEEFR